MPMDAEWRSSVDSRLGAIEASLQDLRQANIKDRLARMEEAAITLKRYVMGNGQPGKCEREAARLTQIEQAMNRAHGALTTLRWTASALGLLAGTIATIIWGLIKPFLPK